MVPVFVINLDRSADRLARVSRECAQAGVVFARFPAVAGTALPDHLKPYFCDASGNIVSPLTPGEIGCYASHLALWRRIVHENLPAALICEDDAIVPGDIKAIVAEILSVLPHDWDMAFLAG